MAFLLLFAKRILESHQLMNHITGTVLEVAGLSCYRNSRILFQNLDFKLASGELLNLVGQNGSGKTTLLRILCGLREPDAGTIQSVYKAGQIAFSGHNTAMKNDLSVLENLRFWRAVHTSENTVDLEGLLTTFNLLHLANNRFHTLSAGQKCRTRLAVLMINPKPIWLLDEPFTSLDSEGVDLVQHMIITHLRNHGTVIVSSHARMHIAWPSQQYKELAYEYL